MALYISDANGQLNKVAVNFGEDAGKANIDASNLSSANVGNWQSTLKQGYEFVANYALAPSGSSYRLQLCDAGDFTKYDYKIILITPTVPQGQLVMFDFGSSTTDYGTGNPESVKYGIETTSTSSGSRTPMGYFIDNSNEILYSNARATEISATFDIMMNETSGNRHLIYFLGQSGRLWQGQSYNHAAIRFIDNSNLANTTHIHIYLSSGSFSDFTGHCIVLRSKKQ